MGAFSCRSSVSLRKKAGQLLTGAPLVRLLLFEAGVAVARGRGRSENETMCLLPGPASPQNSLDIRFMRQEDENDCHTPGISPRARGMAQHWGVWRERRKAERRLSSKLSQASRQMGVNL